MKTNTIILLFTIVLSIIIFKLPFKAKFYGDWTFHAEAKTVVAWVYGQAPFEALSITKAPGPVLFYALPYVVAGTGKEDSVYWKWALVWNLLWLAFAIILIKDTAKLLFGSHAAAIAVILTFLLPLHLYYGMGVIAETMAFIGVSLFTYGTVILFSDAIRIRSGSIALIAGLLGIITARPNSLLILAIFPIVMFWLWRKEDTNLRAGLQRYFQTYITTCVLVTILSVGIRFLPGNQAQSLQESYFIHVAHHGRFQFRTESWDWRFWDNDIRSDSRDFQLWQASSKSMKQQMTDREQSMSETYAKWIVLDMIRHPLLVIKQFGIRLIYGHFLQISSAKPEQFTLGPIKGKWMFYVCHAGINLFNILLLIAAFKGFLKTYRKQPFLFFLLVPWIALAIFHGLIYMEQRYMYPVRPIILIFAASAIYYTIQAAMRKTHYSSITENNSSQL